MDDLGGDSIESNESVCINGGLPWRCMVGPMVLFQGSQHVNWTVGTNNEVRKSDGVSKEKNE